MQAQQPPNGSVPMPKLPKLWQNTKHRTTTQTSHKAEPRVGELENNQLVKAPSNGSLNKHKPEGAPLS